MNAAILHGKIKQEATAILKKARHLQKKYSHLICLEPTIEKIILHTPCIQNLSLAQIRI